MGATVSRSSSAEPNNRLPKLSASNRPSSSELPVDPLTVTQVLPITPDNQPLPLSNTKLEESKEQPPQFSTHPSNVSVSLDSTSSTASLTPPAVTQLDVKQIRKKVSLPPLKSSRTVPSAIPLEPVKRSLDDPYNMPEGYVKNGQVARVPDDEDERIRALISYGVLDSDPEEGFDSLARLAAEICETPIALISFIDTDRQWFKARVGLGAHETHRDVAFCSHAILDAKEVFEVQDSTKDPRFADNILVKSTPYVRFYAGAPIVDDATGFALGTVCAIDNYPRKLNDFQTRALKTLAQQCMAQLELKKRIQTLTSTLAQLHDTKCALREAKDLAEANQIKAEKSRVEAEEANKHKSLFLSHISHEIRTPLNGLLGMAWLLQATSLSSEQADYAGHIQSSGDHLMTILNDLLDFSKQEAGHMKLEMAPVCPVAMIEQAIHLTYRSQTHAGIDVFYSVHPDCPPVIRADPTRLRQILSNCLSNALKFTASVPTPPSISAPKAVVKELKRGQVWVEVEPTSELGTDGHPCVRFSIHDSGIGMNDESISKLFSAFTQVHENRQYAGTGLGLVLSKLLTEGHGGSMGVRSTLGEGSTFHFTISTPQNYAHDVSHSLDLAINQSLLITQGGFEVCMLPQSHADYQHRMIFVNSNSTQTKAFINQFARWGIELIGAANESELSKLINQHDIRRDLCGVLVNHLPECGIDLQNISRLMKRIELADPPSINLVACADNPVISSPPAQSRSSAGHQVSFPCLPLIGLLPAAMSDAAELSAINASYAATVRHPVLFTQLKHIIENVLSSIDSEEAINLSNSSTQPHSRTQSRRLSGGNLLTLRLSQHSSPGAMTRQTSQSTLTSKPRPVLPPTAHNQRAATTKKPIFAHLATDYPLKLLVVEDNLVNTKLLTRMLVNLGYSDFQTAVDGLQAKEIMVDQQQQFDLVLVDMMMPRMNGPEFVAAVLAHYRSERPDVVEPIFCAMTASVLAADEQRCLESGMQEFVSKPINPGRLQEVIVKIGKQINSQRLITDGLDHNMQQHVAG